MSYKEFVFGFGYDSLAGLTRMDQAKFSSSCASEEPLRNRYLVIVTSLLSLCKNAMLDHIHARNAIHTHSRATAILEASRAATCYSVGEGTLFVRQSYRYLRETKRGAEASDRPPFGPLWRQRALVDRLAAWLASSVHLCDSLPSYSCASLKLSQEPDPRVDLGSVVEILPTKCTCVTGTRGVARYIGMLSVYKRVISITRRGPSIPSRVHSTSAWWKICIHQPLALPGLLHFQRRYCLLMICGSSRYVACDVGFVGRMNLGCLPISVFRLLRPRNNCCVATSQASCYSRF